MADADLEIRVKSSADLAAIQQTMEQLDQIEKRVSDLRSKYPPFAGAGGGLPPSLEPPIPEGLAGAAKPEDISAGYEGIITHAKDAQKATEAAATTSLLWGANIARARNEAVTLVRELAAGAPITRTLGALLGSLGVPIAGAALAAFGMFETFAKISDRQKDLAEEFDKNIDKAEKLADALREGARGATTPEDVTKVAQQGAASITQVKEKLEELRNKSTGFWKTEIDDWTQYFTSLQSGIPVIDKALGSLLAKLGTHLPTGFRPFSDALDRDVKSAEQLNAAMEKVSGSAIRAGQRSEEAFRAEKLKPIAEAIRDVTNEINRLQGEQAKVNLQLPGGPETWNAINQQIEEQRKRLTALIGVEKEESSFDEASRGAQINRLVEMNAKIEDVQKSLRNLGVEAKTPLEAFNIGKNTVGDLGVTIEQLAKKWAGLNTQIAQHNVEVERTTQNLRDQVTLTEAKLEGHTATLRNLEIEIAYDKEIRDLQKSGTLTPETQALVEQKRAQAYREQTLRDFEAGKGTGASGAVFIQRERELQDQQTRIHQSQLDSWQRDLQDRVRRGVHISSTEAAAAGLDRFGRPLGAQPAGQPKQAGGDVQAIAQAVVEAMGKIQATGQDRQTEKLITFLRQIWQ